MNQAHYQYGHLKPDDPLIGHLCASKFAQVPDQPVDVELSVDSKIGPPVN